MATPATGAIQILDVDKIGRKQQSHLRLLQNAGIDGVAPIGTITVIDNDTIPEGVNAESTVTIVDNSAIVPSSSISNNFTGALVEGVNWSIGDTDTDTATSIASGINTVLGYSAATAVDGVITCVANSAGSTNWDWDAPTDAFTCVNTVSGVPNPSISYSGPYGTGSIERTIDWDTGATEDDTAESIKSALNTRFGAVIATRSGFVVTATSLWGSDSNWSFGVPTGMTATDENQGIAPLTFVLSGTTYVAGPSFTGYVGFDVGATMTDTLNNIKTVMEADATDGSLYDFSVVDDKIVATSKIRGLIPGYGSYNFSMTVNPDFATVTTDFSAAGNTQASAEMIVLDWSAIKNVGTFATGTITIDDYSLIVPGTVLHIVDLSTYENTFIEGSEWSASSDNATTASSLATAITNMGLDQLIKIDVSGNVITLTGALCLSEANIIQFFFDNNDGISTTGPNLAGGTDGVILNICGEQIGHSVSPTSVSNGFSYGWSINDGFNADTSNEGTASLIATAVSNRGVASGKFTAQNTLHEGENTGITCYLNYEYKAGSLGNDDFCYATNLPVGDSLTYPGVGFSGGRDVGLTINVGAKQYEAFTDFDFPNDATEDDVAQALSDAIIGSLPPGVASCSASGDTATVESQPGSAGNFIGLRSSKIDAATCPEHLDGGEGGMEGQTMFFSGV